MSQINTVIKTLRKGHFPAVFQCVLPKHYSTQNEPEIIVPKRIQRSPTDILRALSKIVKRDPTAPHYKYHDDPYLIPASNYAKRSYALAQESGRKAARWILQEHADLFQHKVADPFVEVFAPKQIITEESDVDVDSLNKALSNLAVTDAITIYQILQEKNIELSKEQLQNLLELVCFYNAEDKLEDDWIEERWFKQGARDKVKQRKTWKDGGIAESIFLSIDPPDSKSFSALIVGMGNYGQLEHAWKYYDEARGKGLKLNPGVYNVLIRNVSFIREQHDARWTSIKDLLNEMNLDGVMPDVTTLNAILEALCAMSINKNSKLNALSTVAEFRQIGIEPSLASYYYLLKLYCRDRNRTSSILVDIMNVLDGKTFTIKDPKDTFFFVTAMEICNTHLSDIDLANRVHNLLLTGDNYNLIGDSYKESVYLRNYFFLKSQYDTIEDFMQFYDLYVPNIYVPEPVVMEAVLNTVDMNGANQYLPRLWFDMVLFDHITRENLVTLIIETLYKNPAVDNIELANKLADTAESILEKINESNDQTTTMKSVSVSWTGSMLGHLLSVLLQADRFDKACEVIFKLDKNQQTILGVPDVRPIKMFIDKAIERKDVDNAMMCLQYCYDAGYEEIQSLGQNIYNNLKLSEAQLSRLKTVVNLDTLSESSN